MIVFFFVMSAWMDFINLLKEEVINVAAEIQHKVGG